MNNREIYFESIINQLPRLLSLLNRNTGSAAYGCFDRQYWLYRVVDFPCVRHQEAVLTLSLIYGLQHKDNPYFENENILEWIKASIEFWHKIQDKNGSFNEWYPHENSFVGTAFSAYAISESLLCLGEQIKVNSILKIALEGLKKAGDWLIPEMENRAMNQSCGAIIALYNIYLLTDDVKYLNAVGEKISLLEKYQNPEGWINEYGGADIGYLSLAIDYLAKYYDKSKDEKALKIIQKAVLFIRNFILLDYTFGGSYSSRNTEYIIPSGFEIMAGYIPEAADIARTIRTAIAKKATVIPAYLDDRYLAYMGYTYLQAYTKAALQIPDYAPKLPSTVNYPGLGIEIVKNDNFSLVFNYKKGGTFKITFSNNESLLDWGLIIESHNKKKYFSGWLNKGVGTTKNNGQFFTANTHFQEIRQLMPSPVILVFSRIILPIMSWQWRLSKILKNKLRDLMITRQTNTQTKLKRTLFLKDDGISIIDRIINGKDIKNIILNAKVSYIYVPSSCYYQPNDLCHQRILLQPEKRSNDINIVRNYNLKGVLTSVNLTYD